MCAGRRGATGHPVRTPLKLGSTGDIDMSFKAIVHGVALIAVLGFISGRPGRARRRLRRRAGRAQEADRAGDQLHAQSKRHRPGLRRDRTDPRRHQGGGAARSAAECYDDGSKRTAILAEYDKGIQEMESKINGVCK